MTRNTKTTIAMNGQGSPSSWSRVPKATVAAGDRSVEEAIEQMRRTLRDGNVRVNSDGTIYNPSAQAQQSSIDSGEQFKPVPKATVAAGDRSVEEAIEQMRRTLRDGNVRVNSDGTIYNPSAQSQQSSIDNGEQFKPVPKATVAAGDRSVEEAIKQMRRTLREGNVRVNSDGTIYNPSAQSQQSSIDSGEQFKPVPKATVAAGDRSVEEAIKEMRRTLRDGNVRVNSDGTIYNPSAQSQQSSIDNGEQFKPVPKATVAAQWYETNPDLQVAEIAAMKDIKPDAKWGYLPNGQMYWDIHLRPVGVDGHARDWTLLAVYDSDHPQQRWGGSVKFYPVSPNYDEMMALVREHDRYPLRIPHLITDRSGQLYMCTQHQDRIQAGRHVGELVSTAATGLRYAMRWIGIYELGLIDQTTWEMFQGEGRI